MTKTKSLLGFLLMCVLICCKPSLEKESKYDYLLTEGVSAELAEFRKENYRDIAYSLYFDIPDSLGEQLQGNANISLTVANTQPLILDFFTKEEWIKEVVLNGELIDYRFKNGHIFIYPPEGREVSKHTLCVRFAVNSHSLNRENEFLYTLLVPNKAHTLFPCFDQPDLKANYTLSLHLPNGWEAVSNSPVESEKDGVIRFQETEPLSTYLFAFVAGKFDKEKQERNGREITLYHRETDPKKVAQCPDIAKEVFDALEWMEEYTTIPYPFAKYDLIILPGFQFGGMEHTGATLYNDRRMFLNEQPTLNERLSRSSLIAHETAHMWFGDYVTMKWFDDVWTKEVFANYFAARMVEPLYPTVNHDLNFLRSYYPAAYSEDRTAGTTSIKQELDNLTNAGLIYGQIIYNKSPIVMEKLLGRLGEESFRKGIQEYLHTYAYGNATWEELVAIFDKYTEEDLEEWSHVWIHEKGMPEIKAHIENKQLVVTQSDPLNRGLIWPQEISYTLLDGNSRKTIPIVFKIDSPAIRIDLPEANNPIILPNSDGKGYGYFPLSEADARHVMMELKRSRDDVFSGSLLIILYENVIRKNIDPQWYVQEILSYISQKNNPLLNAMALSNMARCVQLFSIDTPPVEKALWQMVHTHPDRSFRLQAFRTYASLADSNAAIDRLYTVWKNKEQPGACLLSENDYTDLSYKMMMYKPDLLSDIYQEQTNRITNPDRREQYAFVSSFIKPNDNDRLAHSVVLSLTVGKYSEPWIISALNYLHHPKFQRKEGVAVADFVGMGLVKLDDIQREGDIFLPTNWARAILSNYTSEEARQGVEQVLSEKEFHPLLKNKILQQADHLYR